MIINATDLKNSLGKYLRSAAREEIIITSNGRKVARLTAYEDFATKSLPTKSSGASSPIAFGRICSANDPNEVVMERAEAYTLSPRKATYEEFLEISENSDERYEYIDGEIYLLASPKTIHQQVLGELFVFFYNWFKGKNCRPMLAPYDITLKRNADNINVVQPDLMVICDLEENLNEKNYYMGVPSLMIEILSESSRGKDAVKKLDLYMSTGVREYWIVNPFNKEVNVFLFENLDVAKNATYKGNENLVSFIFDDLEVSLKEIFG